MMTLRHVPTNSLTASAVRDGLEHLFAQPFGPEQGSPIPERLA
jgi:hypothetical protein